MCGSLSQQHVRWMEKIRDNLWFSLKKIHYRLYHYPHLCLFFFQSYSSYKPCCWRLRRRLTGKKTVFIISYKSVVQFVLLIITVNHLLPALLPSIQTLINWPNEINSYVFFRWADYWPADQKFNLLCTTRLQVRDEFLDVGLCKSTVAAR